MYLTGRRNVLDRCPFRWCSHGRKVVRSSGGLRYLFFYSISQIFLVSVSQVSCISGEFHAPTYVDDFLLKRRCWQYSDELSHPERIKWGYHKPISPPLLPVAAPVLGPTKISSSSAGSSAGTQGCGALHQRDVSLVAKGCVTPSTIYY